MANELNNRIKLLLNEKPLKNNNKILSAGNNIMSTKKNTDEVREMLGLNGGSVSRMMLKELKQFNKNKGKGLEQLEGGFMLPILGALVTKALPQIVRNFTGNGIVGGAMNIENLVAMSDTAEKNLKGSAVDAKLINELKQLEGKNGTNKLIGGKLPILSSVTLPVATMMATKILKNGLSGGSIFGSIGSLIDGLTGMGKCGGKMNDVVADESKDFDTDASPLDGGSIFGNIGSLVDSITGMGKPDTKGGARPLSFYSQQWLTIRSKLERSADPNPQDLKSLTIIMHDLLTDIRELHKTVGASFLSNNKTAYMSAVNEYDKYWSLLDEINDWVDVQSDSLDEISLTDFRGDPLPRPEQLKKLKNPKWMSGKGKEALNRLKGNGDIAFANDMGSQKAFTLASLPKSKVVKDGVKRGGNFKNPETRQSTTRMGGNKLPTMEFSNANVTGNVEFVEPAGRQRGNVYGMKAKKIGGMRRQRMMGRQRGGANGDSDEEEDPLPLLPARAFDRIKDATMVADERRLALYKSRMARFIDLQRFVEYLERIGDTQSSDYTYATNEVNRLRGLIGKKPRTQGGALDDDIVLADKQQGAGLFGNIGNLIGSITGMGKKPRKQTPAMKKGTQALMAYQAKLKKLKSQGMTHKEAQAELRAMKE